MRFVVTKIILTNIKFLCKETVIFARNVLFVQNDFCKNKPHRNHIKGINFFNKITKKCAVCNKLFSVINHQKSYLNLFWNVMICFLWLKLFMKNSTFICNYFKMCKKNRFVRFLCFFYVNHFWQTSHFFAIIFKSIHKKTFKDIKKKCAVCPKRFSYKKPTKIILNL